jgi:hypothetical protein
MMSMIIKRPKPPPRAHHIHELSGRAWAFLVNVALVLEFLVKMEMVE